MSTNAISCPPAVKPNLKRKQAEVSSESDSIIKNSTLKQLECPVCYDLPRAAPIYHCLSCGHLLCKDCKPKVSRCPMCRSKPIDQRNLFAERVLVGVLVNTLLDCRNRDQGCSVRDVGSRVGDHERVCVYREAKCPGHHRGACKWVGPLSKLIPHVVEMKCAQIVKCRDADQPFTSVIGDFNAEAMTVFGRNAMTHWKPVLFISRQVIRLFAYLVSYRDMSGNWILYLRSYSAAEALDKVQASLSIRKPVRPNETGTNTNDESINSISFRGRILPHDFTEQQVIDSGSFLCLRDSQVKQLCVDRTLFEYSVQITELA